MELADNTFEDIDYNSTYFGFADTIPWLVHALVMAKLYGNFIKIFHRWILV